MSSTLLEVTRAAHEEVERLERLIVKDLQNEPTSNKDRLFQSHRVRNMIDTITSTTEKLVSCLLFRLYYIFCFYHDGHCFFRLRFTRTKTVQGRMRLLHWEDKLLLELMFSAPSTIDSKRFYFFSFSIFVILIIF